MLCCSLAPETTSSNELCQPRPWSLRVRRAAASSVALQLLQQQSVRCRKDATQASSLHTPPCAGTGTRHAGTQSTPPLARSSTLQRTPRTPGCSDVLRCSLMPSLTRAVPSEQGAECVKARSTGEGGQLCASAAAELETPPSSCLTSVISTHTPTSPAGGRTFTSPCLPDGR